MGWMVLILVDQLGEDLKGKFIHIKHGPQFSPNTLNIISTYPWHVDHPIQNVLLNADQTIPAYIPPLQ